MASGNNFNVSELTDLQARASSTFTSILENISAIKGECGEMSSIVLSEDSALGSRWDSVSSNMEKPIQTIDDTFLVVKTLLDTYVSDTIENERAAQAELENIDEGISSLGNLASALLDGLSALRGIGFGATAIAIPGLTIGGGDGDDTVSIGEQGSIPVMKYAPPEYMDEPVQVMKYAPPTIPDPEVTIKYAPPTIPDPEVTIKYAPPTIPDPEVTTKYAPPTISDPEVTIKYAPPGFGEPIPVMKYAPPEYMDPTPVMKYAPPDMMGVDTKVKKGK